MWLLVPLAALAAFAYWSIPSEGEGTSSGTGSAWARARARSSGPSRPAEPTATEAARICAQSADAIPVDSPDLAAWADCPGRPIRDLRVLAARLERAATDATDAARRARLVAAHVELVDWIARREREREAVA